MANYKKVNKTGLKAMVNSLKEFEELQSKYGLTGIQCIRELKDTIIGVECGVDMINKDQDDFDGYKSDTGDHYENKNVGLRSKKIICTFPDLPANKIDTLEKENTILTVSVWDGVVDPKFVLIGNGKNVAGIIRKKWNKIDPKRRKSVTLSYKELVDGGFDVVLMDSTFDEFINTIREKYPSKKAPNRRMPEVWARGSMKSVVAKQMNA